MVCKTIFSEYSLSDTGQQTSTSAPNSHYWLSQFDVSGRLWQPDLTEIHTYFTRWLIHMNSFDLTCTIHMIFAKSYGFYELLIHMNL